MNSRETLDRAWPTAPYQAGAPKGGGGRMLSSTFPDTFPGPGPTPGLRNQQLPWKGDQGHVPEPGTPAPHCGLYHDRSSSQAH